MRKTLVTLSILLIGPFTAFSASAQSQQPSGKDSQSGSASELKVQTAVPSDAMFELRTAVRALREASVLLLEPGASKQPGPARQKAFEAAQDAIFKVQRAMVRLPNAYHGGEIREAKDWPVVAARIDKASVAIEKAVADLEKSGGKQNSSAIQELNGALDDAEKALRAMPEWRIGSAK